MGGAADDVRGPQEPEARSHGLVSGSSLWRVAEHVPQTTPLWLKEYFELRALGPPAPRFFLNGDGIPGKPPSLNREGRHSHHRRGRQDSSLSKLLSCVL